MDYVFVALGGAIGSCLRYAASRYLLLGSEGLVWATVFVNTLGSFLIGFLWVFFASRSGYTDNLRLLLMVGLLGGFTTFSTFSLETVNFFVNEQWRLAIMNIIGSLLSCLTAVSVGVWLGRLLFKS